MGTTLYSHEKYVRPVLIKVTDKEAIWNLREGYKDLFGTYPSDESMACLYAQVMLETGRFKLGFYNNNYGNLKKTFKPGDENLFTMFATGENLVNTETKKLEYRWFQPPDPQTAFRAYNSIREGAIDYINFLSKRTRYTTAWQALLDGDPAKYSHELHEHGYYTADEAKYTKGVVNLFNEYIRRKDELLAWQPEPPHATPPQDSGATTDELPTEPENELPTEPAHIVPEPPIPDSPAPDKSNPSSFLMILALGAVGLSSIVSLLFKNCQ